MNISKKFNCFYFQSENQNSQKIDMTTFQVLHISLRNIFNIITAKDETPHPTVTHICTTEIIGCPFAF